MILANEIVEGNVYEGYIQRDKISIKPNPMQIFSKEKNLSLYYEIYNLTKGKDSLTNFEQKITVQKKDEDNVLTDVLNVVGLGNKGEKISTKSNYQTLESDTQIYFQLDLSNNEAGNYLISIGIKDRVANSEAALSTDILLIE